MPFVNRMASLHVVGLRDSKTMPVEVPLDTLDNLLGAEMFTHRSRRSEFKKGSMLIPRERFHSGTDFLLRIDMSSVN